MKAAQLGRLAGRVGPGLAQTGLAWPGDVAGAVLSSACLPLSPPLPPQALTQPVTAQELRNLNDGNMHPAFIRIPCLHVSRCRRELGPKSASRRRRRRGSAIRSRGPIRHLEDDVVSVRKLQKIANPIPSLVKQIEKPLRTVALPNRAFGNGFLQPLPHLRVNFCWTGSEYGGIHAC